MSVPVAFRAVLAFAASLCLFLSPAWGQSSDKDWKLPEADARKWTDRIRKLCPAGWTVTARGNDIIVQRDAPVAFLMVYPGMPAPMPDKSRAAEDKRKKQQEIVRTRVYRLTLQFAPKMSQDDFEKLAAENVVSDNADLQLRRKYRIGSPPGVKPSVWIPRTEDDKQRDQAYNEEARKLIRHRLPDFYSPDYSIFFYYSWHWLEGVETGDADVDAECNHVEEVLINFFGIYDPSRATQRSSVGHPEFTREKP